MATIRKTVTLTDRQDEWIKAQIARGDYTNDSEYIRDLIRRDQDLDGKRRALKHAVAEGLASGISKRKVGQIWRAAEKHAKASRG